MSDMADFTVQHEEGDQAVLHLSGVLDITTAGMINQQLNALDQQIDVIDLNEVDEVDTVGAWIVHRLRRDHMAEVRHASPEAMRLMGAVASADEPGQVKAPVLIAPLRILAEMGEATSHAFASMFGTIGFIGSLLASFFDVVREPSRFRWRALVRHFELVGVTALGIVGLMSFLIGIVIAQQGAVQLRQFGAEIFTINLVGRLTLRELGVLMTAIMVAGRSGSAFAAQIGTMKLTEEVDAMRTIGVEPMQALVLPRVLAAVLMMPLLGFYSSLVAMFGGAILCALTLDIPISTFVTTIQQVVPMHDLWVGLVKAPVFGAIVALSGCYQGMLVKGNAEDVGLRTTAAVVQAIFMIIVLDAFFAVFFTWVGWG
ncbi:ABC transporter permease [Alterisphingorhabdus coralli]|uniref:ABC transporter permease n=1 Tax=Alterisphingorhabdus coralli TaxID=3071408 RepID=A0AA97F6B2_9SPHN|nr:ABC transporter permease [Parasphingorhabdus sp. SCSIO 66989]WOE75159.1 ABC transporter permease [Parasphingorhabdus sp. SCSIO 66989]